jgi:uncharacterized protein
VFEVITEAYFRSDWEAAFALIDPEIVWVEPEGMPGSGTYHGHDGVRESLTKFVGTWDDYRVEHHDITEAGDKLYLRAHISGKGRTSGVPGEFDQFQVWTFREGRFVRMEMFLDEDDARRAAGIETADKETA